MALLRGTEQNDTLIGTPKADRLFGLSGNDSLSGRGGDDLISGGNGRDTLEGGNGNDTLLGGNQTDWLYASQGKDLLSGGRGSDTFVISRHTGSATLAQADSILDFHQGKDSIGLADGLTFNDLKLSPATGTAASRTVITDKLTGQVLVVLPGVDSRTIDSADFVSLSKSYAFTKIADTSGSFDEVGGGPINDSGTVAFAARSEVSLGFGLYTGNGGPLTTIVEPNDDFFDPREGSFNFFNGLAINNQGTVVFGGTPYSGSEGLFAGSGGAITTIADVDGPFSFISNGFAINQSGTIVFAADFDAGGNGIFSSTGGQLSTVADTNGIFSYFDQPYPTINDRGVVAFQAGLDTGGSGIFTSSDGQIATVADNSGALDAFIDTIEINNHGVVVFPAYLDTGENGVFTSDGGQVTTVADSSGAFSTFDNVAINDSGMVAFAASLDAGAADVFADGIYTGSDPIADQVIAIGDALAGSTVTNLFFSPDGLNDAGQIAFTATLADGTVGSFRADPVLFG